MKKFSAPLGIDPVTFWLAAKWEVILVPSATLYGLIILILKTIKNNTLYPPIIMYQLRRIHLVSD
jgi:hypothetical protein